MDPASGRFTQMDTWQGLMSNPLTLNKYLYGNANPVNSVDPSGHMTLASVSIGISISIPSIVRAGVGLTLGYFLYPAVDSAANAVRTTIWDIIVYSKIAHHVPEEVMEKMEAARVKAEPKTHKSPERHHTIPMYLCGHSGQYPLALVSYAEHQMLHAGLSAVQLSVEKVGDNVADILNIPFERRRNPTIQAIGRNQIGRAGIASAIGAFYMFTPAGSFGGGAVNSAFSQVRGPFVGGYTSCN